MKLTIAIPTYNRNEILKKNLILLLPQLTSDCRLLIVDNSSDNFVENDLKDLLNNYQSVEIKIIRNRHNIGLTGNILRCFEMCEDPWLWILGDDDEVKENAVKQILLDIKKYRNYHFINYAWDIPSLQRKEEITTHGIDNFIDCFETLGVVLFISAGVYNTKNISSNLAFGNFFQTTYAPHLVMLFLSLGDEGRCLLSNKQTVINKGFDTPSILRWDQIFIYQITLLLRLPLKPNAIYKLKQRLVQLTRVWTISHAIFTLVFIGCSEKTSKRTLILYDEFVRGFFYLDRRPLSRIIILGGYILVEYPFLFKGLLNHVYKMIRGKKFDPITNLRV
jgi:glycosyltransferase involved in cell wall biosynthesis